jgi:hypothetical protein
MPRWGCLSLSLAYIYQLTNASLLLRPKTTQQVTGKQVPLIGPLALDEASATHRYEQHPGTPTAGAHRAAPVLLS